YQCVPFHKQAYHAGESMLNGRPNCNEWCIGIEHLSTGDIYRGEPAYTEEQIVTSRAVHRDLMSRYGIERQNIAGHDHVRQAAIIAGMRKRNGDPLSKKFDPGVHFPWHEVLPEHGL